MLAASFLFLSLVVGVMVDAVVYLFRFYSFGGKFSRKNLNNRWLIYRRYNFEPISFPNSSTLTRVTRFLFHKNTI